MSSFAKYSCVIEKADCYCLARRCGRRRFGSLAALSTGLGFLAVLFARLDQYSINTSGATCSTCASISQVKCSLLNPVHYTRSKIFFSPFSVLISLC